MMKAIAMLLAIALSACAVTAPVSRPVCGPCLVPSSGPVYLDELQVRALLAGVEREEGQIRKERDEALTGKTNAEAYAESVKRDAVIAGTSAAVLAAMIAAAITAALAAKKGDQK